MDTLMSWVKIWLAAVKTFFRHPIITIKGFIADFLAADAKGKLKKIAFLGVFIFGFYVALQVVVGIVIILWLIGMISNPGEYYYDEYEGRWKRYF